MQRTMGLEVEGPTTKKLVKEVCQAIMQGTMDLQELKTEFNSLQENIEVKPTN